MTSPPSLSDEQRDAVDRAVLGHDLAIVARAGSGKSHTLRAIAHRSTELRRSRRPRAPHRTLVLAFNRTVARDARARLPPGATATTVHGLAYRTVVAHDPRMRAKLERANAPTADEAWRSAIGLDPRDPAAARHAAIVLALLARFLSDDASTPDACHVPSPVARQLEHELGHERWQDRRRWLVRRADRLWQRISDPDDPLPLPHDGYLKLFAERRVSAPADLLLIDEAQDLAPVTLGWLQAQDAQSVLVGDPAQRIYGWRGAVDAMAASGHPEVRLTRSFRFGASIATIALRILRVLAPGARLTGVGREGRVVAERSHDPSAAPLPRAVLCRGNGGVLEAVLAHAEHGVHVVGGLSPALSHLHAAYGLWRRRDAPRTPAERPDAFEGFTSWAALVAAAETHGGPLRTVHALVETYGDALPERLDRVRRAVRDDPASAAVTVSTVHRAKGREWDHVELWSDLARVPADAQALAAAPDPERAREEANLLYVAVTRARRTLLLGRVSRDVHALLLPDHDRDTARRT